LNRTLVTGATGFIGRVVVRTLARDDGAGVRALVRGPAAERRLAAVAPPGVECAEGDLLDLTSIRRAVTDCEAVVHLAACVDPALCADEEAVDRVNRGAAVALAERAREAGCRHFVFVSSIAAMGFFAGLATPATACRPQSAYGRAKLAAERAILALANERFHVVVLRPPTVYGPGERYNFLSWVRATDRGLFRVIGSGDNVMPLCTTDNLARAARAAAAGEIEPGIHLVADDDHYAVSRIHRAICAALGRSTPRLRIPRGAALVAGATNEVLARAFGAPLVLSRARVRTLTVDQPFDLASLGRARRELDAPLEKAVASTVDDYRDAGLLGKSNGSNPP
jgi:nucleoside-diphosphate-sugar epimerase